MIPSLVVSEIRAALVEYLASTFALSDDEVRDALSAFLTDNAEGIFRGPYLRVRTPFRQVDASWQSPLDWQPEWFVPYQHQATAFERLSTARGRTAQPTLVTTGTGSGKTECFLMPMLDHCARMRGDDHNGIKAVILYPMNALASDQAGRIAELIHHESALSGLRAGLYVGDAGRYSDMGADHLIDKREVLRSDPPDILLTNYKMLDFLLLRQEDRDLWAVNTPDTLQYIVLDEFHTYDGAQGTDVAMLMRRLGATLGMATDQRPLGNATPVGTSATLGSGITAQADLRAFATKVFGTDFDEDSVIGETRQTVEEACLTVDYGLPIPDVADIIALVDADDVAAAFCIDPDAPKPIHDVVELGTRLLQHPLTRAVLSSVGDRSRSWSDAVAEIVTRAPNWGRAYMTDPASVEEALAQFLRLLSAARREQGGNQRPLFSIEIQLWIREVSRLLRSVTNQPEFRWRDSAAPMNDDEDDEGARVRHELPAIYCRRCGTSGWMAIQSETSESFAINPNRITTAAMQRSPLVRSLLRANPEDPEAKWYSPSLRRLDPRPLADAEHDVVPVLITSSEDDAKANRCPSCAERDSIRFLGLAVASLASVSINTLFGSEHLEEKERKLLAFTDSVQDASHRAAFFGGRTHRINLRSLMARVIREHGTGGVNLADLGDLVLAEASTARDIFGLIPPDLTLHPVVKTAWHDHPADGAIDLLALRIGFEADLEFGLRSRVGRTLELSRAAAARVIVPDFDPVVDLISEVIQTETGERPDPIAVAVYVRGLVERLRLRGGLLHPLLDRFVAEGGLQWWIWGGRPDGLPPFTPDQGRPSFFTTNTKGDLDSITALASVHTWIVNWAMRTLDVTPAQAKELNQRALALLASETDVVVARRAGANTVYGLDRRFVEIVDIVDPEGEPTAASVRCAICGHVHVVAPAYLDAWVGTACLRYRCVGTFETVAPRKQNYYRTLYRSGRTRRVVTGEHTGLLQRSKREDLEKAFKDGTAPNAPNVITATPTLEMGIDIGDLSAVMLTSVPRNPASYIQRVGRAGRLTGNSLVTTFVRTDTHGLYYLADPEAMLAGDVRPPNCFLDAIETLQRQYVAYVVDRIADQSIDGPPLPRQIGALMNGGLDEGGFLRAIIDASTLDTEHVDRFLSLFGTQLPTPSLEPATLDKLREFAAAGIEQALKGAEAVWEQHKKELELRRNRLKTAIERLEEQGSDSPDVLQQLASLRGQRAAVITLLRDHRDEYSLSALERLGVLPNYSLVDDSVTLSATLWFPEDDGGYGTEVIEYKRSGRLAVKEFAPGNSFYAGGHKHVIDALEIGSADQPLYETWRLCKECGFGMIEPEGETPSVCPRCADKGIADTGARHVMLRLRTALSSGSEENARVYDESDERLRESYSMAQLVDVDPSYVEGAWHLTERSFGAELAGRTYIRTINLGFAERSGEGQLPIAGHPHHVTRFTVCSHCGAVADVRDDRDGSQPQRLHQGWCKVRSGAMKEDWDSIVIFHELITEAIRMVVPVSMFEVEERLASFKGALLLGIREDFGGDPAHLQVALADAPNRTGQGRRRFLVLFDSVPGGTGYLARMADPQRVREILEAGRNVIARCPCSNEGRPACHRCILGVVDRHEYDVARRDIALEILDDLLGAWAPEPIDTVAGIDIGKIEESELERRFKVALQDWARGITDEHVSCQKVPGVGRYEAFELRLKLEGVRTRYRIDEQAGLSNLDSTLPDFLIRRLDTKAPDVAVYLDGFQFHASPEINNIASDARKRRQVRDDGHLVWNLTWDDVDVFHKAVRSDPPREPGQRTLLKGPAKSTARSIHRTRDGLYDLDAVDQNPMALLLDYLARPDLGHWERVAMSAVGGLFADGDSPVAVADAQVEQALKAVASGNRVESSCSPAEAATLLRRYQTSNGLTLGIFLDATRPNDERWTVVSALADTETAVAEEQHRLRWRDWVQWSNVLQFLRSPGRAALIAGFTEVDNLPFDDLDIVSPPADQQDGPIDVSETMIEELELVEDQTVRELVRAALVLGAADFVAGDELDGRPLEAAWSAAKVAVLLSEETAFTNGGWDARPPAEWSADELARTIVERT